MEKLDVIWIGNEIVDIIERKEDVFMEKNGIIKGDMKIIEEEREEII